MINRGGSDVGIGYYTLTLHGLFISVILLLYWFYSFLEFYVFLGSSVNELAYWGKTDNVRKQHHQRKLSSLNQFFLTLINLRNKHLAFRFGISASLVSRYFTTFSIVILIKEIQWMPEVKQVKGILPNSFHQKYPTTYAIIDGSELFIFYSDPK